MTANMKVIIAAAGIAVLASPAMAQPEHRNAATAASIARAHGAVARTHAPQRVYREPVDANQDASRIDVHDCSLKSVFTQCGFAH